MMLGRNRRTDIRADPQAGPLATGNDAAPSAPKSFWGSVTSSLNPLAYVTPQRPASTQHTPSPLPAPPGVHGLKSTNSRFKAAPQQPLEQATTVTSPTFPEVHKTALPTRHSSAAANMVGKLDTSTPAVLQGPTPPMSSLEAPTKSIVRAPSDSEAATSSIAEDAVSSGIDPATDLHASNQGPPEGVSPTLALTPGSSAPPSKDKELLAVSELVASTKDGEAVAVDGAGVTSGTPELEVGAEPPSAVVKGCVPERQDQATLTTADKAEDPTAGTTNDTTNSSSSTPGGLARAQASLTESSEAPGEAPPPLVESKAAEDESSSAEAAPASAPTQNATVASVVPLVESGDPQIANPPTDVQSQNDVSDKTSQLPVDAAVETSAPPYKAYPDDEIISFTPGAKVWPVVIVEVILPSTYSKAPSDLDQRVTERSIASAGEQSVSPSVDTVDTAVVHPDRTTVPVSPTDCRRTNITEDSSEDARIRMSRRCVQREQKN
jgi:hypothetical protein